MKRAFVLLMLLAVLFSLAAACTSPTPTAVPKPTVASAPTVAVSPTATKAPTPTTIAAVATVAPTPTPPSSATPAPTAAAGHKPEGNLVVAVSTVGRETWLPWQVTSSETYLSFVNETLLRRKFASRQIEGNLAERWEVSSDAKTWTFYLRKGMQWQEGWGEFTAEDVKYSAERYAAKDSAAARAAVFRDIGSFDIPNPYQITFRFKSPQAGLPYMLTEGRPDFIIVSKKYFEKVGDKEATFHPIGTGSWRFVEHKLGDYIKLEAVEKHWRQTPYFKTLIIKIVPEDATRIAMLKTGEADIAELSLALKKEAEKAGVDIRRFPGASSATMKLTGQILPTWKNYDPKVPWVDTDNPARALKVRKAMNLAVDRQTIIDTVLGGEGILMANNLVVPGSPWDNPAWKPYPYDPDQARALLKEAGYPDGFKVMIWLFTLPGKAEMINFSQAVGQYWEKIGIKVSYEMTEYGVKKGVMAERDFRGGISFPQSHTIWDEPADNWAVTYNSKAPFTFGFEDPRMEAGLAALSAETDLAKRAALNRQMGDIIYNEYREVPLALTNLLWGASPKVGDMPQIPAYTWMHYYEYVTHKGQKP
ncbi:MAG: ABC transporter substrate-binding protein [Dehalococcoidia bacterium]|nr:ABC transporter substrate-binding protein [Dehalococcoidia bacterium]